MPDDEIDITDEEEEEYIEGEDIEFEDSRGFIDNFIKEEEPIKKSRKVVGRMPKRGGYMNFIQPPRQEEPVNIPSLPALPSPSQILSEMQPRQPYYQQNIPRTNPEQIARDQVKIDMIYQRELAKAQRREAMLHRPRMTTSQKCLATAYEHALMPEDKQAKFSAMLRPPRLDNPKSSVKGGDRALSNLNNMIRSVRPAVAVPKTSKKKKGKFGLFA